MCHHIDSYRFQQTEPLSTPTPLGSVQSYFGMQCRIDAGARIPQIKPSQHLPAPPHSWPIGRHLEGGGLTRLLLFKVCPSRPGMQWCVAVAQIKSLSTVGLIDSL